jgi:protein-L-isoaspartate O-methyltransferase
MLDRRLHMVNGQLRTGGVVDKGVLAAFLETPRQHFVAPGHESLAYLDRELTARGAKFRRLLAPMVLARIRLWRGSSCFHGRKGCPPRIRHRRGGGGQG